MDKEVRQFYNEHSKEEDKRLSYHAFELPVTLHYIQKYVKKGSTILDVACGTGHYAERLLDLGYKLHLSDISDEIISVAKKRLQNREGVLSIERFSSTDEEVWKNDKDAVMILGSLYHQLEEEERIAQLKLAKKNSRAGTILFCGFMTRTGAAVYGLKHNPEGIENKNGAEKLWTEGTDKNFVEGTENFRHTYFSDPKEIPILFEKAGIELLHLVGIEGIFGERFDLYHRLTKDKQEQWLKFILKHNEEDAMLYTSKHLLAVGKV